MTAGIVGVFAVGSASGNTGPGETFFEVEITETNGPVVEGDTLVVEATVTNTGSVEDSQQIHLKNSESTIVDSIKQPALTLAPGESANVTLTWNTEPGDSGKTEISVQSNDDTPREDVDILNSDDGSDTGSSSDDGSDTDSTFRPEFETNVTSDSHLTVVAGETVHVNETVENVGSAQGEYVASLRQNGTVVDERTLDIPVRTSEDVALAHTFEQPGVYELTTDAGSTVTVEVVLPTDATLEPVVRDDGSVVATVAHAQPNSAITVPLTAAPAGSPGNATFVTATLALDNGTANATDSFEVTMHTTEAPRNGTEPLPEHVQPIAYLHTNSTDTGAVTNVSYEFVASTDHTTLYRYDSNGSQWVPVPTTAVNETDEGTLRRATVADNATVALGVREPAFSVTEVDSESRRVVNGSSATVTATVVNEGTAPGWYPLALAANGKTIDTKTVSLGAGERRTVSFSFAPDGPGEYDLSAGGNASTTVVVEEVTPTPSSATATESEPDPTPPPATATATEAEPEPSPEVMASGFTAVVALIALGVVVVMLARRD